MEDLIKRLRSFNSKERFFLVGQILGNPKFDLYESFRNELENELKINIPKTGVFTAMDYHFDWLYASLRIKAINKNWIKYSNIYSKDEKFVKGKPEDIDFLIAYKVGKNYHIILIEAKGVTGFTNKQMKSKTERLEIIFGKYGKKWKNVIPHFVLMSPKRPKKLDISNWPEWMKTNGEINLIKLKIPKNLKMVSRCNKPNEEHNEGEYNYWEVIDRNL